MQLDAFADLMRPFGDIETLLLAVSGGPDSTAFMGLAAAWRHGGGTTVSVATVDHRLRLESRNEAEAVGRAAAVLGLPHKTLAWQGPRPNTRIQETARKARYDLLVAHAHSIGASHLATAHTLDDQAETILHRMARGSGPAGLVGMRPSSRRDGIVHLRPLLSVRKARLVATCRSNGWAYCEDPSNADPRYARSRWRRILLQLEPEGLGPDRLAVLSRRLSRAEDALRVQADAAYAGAIVERGDSRVALDGNRLAAQPEEIFLRVLARMLAEVGVGAAAAPIRLQRLERLGGDLRLALATGGAVKRTLAGAMVLARSHGMVEVVRESERRSLRRVRHLADGAPVDYAANCVG